MSLIRRSDKPIEIFYSYSAKDEKLRNKLETHLSLLKQQGLVINWYDRKIVAGSDWNDKISTHLNTADLILLLISPEFMSSEYCYGTEMKRAMERHQAKEAHVIPIILRPVLWEDAPFGKLQFLPKSGKPVTSWRKHDDAFLDIAKGIQEVIKEQNTSIEEGHEKPTSSKKTFGRNTPHILVVEDNLAYLRRIEPQILQRGYNYSFVYDGGEALEIVQMHKFDLIILDLGLPRIGGIEVVRTLRKRNIKTPIIINSVASREFIAEAIRIGADVFVIKRVNAEELFFHIERLLKLDRSQ